MKLFSSSSSTKSRNYLVQSISAAEKAYEVQALDLLDERRYADAEIARGRAVGAHHALTVLEKAGRGWYEDEQVAGELRYLAAMYRRHAESGRLGDGYDLTAKAHVLEWASKLAAQVLGDPRPFCSWHPSMAARQNA